MFFVFTPLQYVLVALGEQKFNLWGSTFNTNRLFTNLIPVYAFLFIPARVALAGDHKRFLERTAKIQVGLLICVYALSHAPALLDLKLATNGVPWAGGNAGVLFFFILVVQLSDASQFVWNHWLGKRIIAPAINESRTWEGFFGGVLTASLIGTALWWVTPLQSAASGFDVGPAGRNGIRRQHDDVGD